MARKQNDLPGVDGPGAGNVHIQEIEDAAEKYEKLRDRRMSILKDEIEAQKELGDLLKANAKKIGVGPDGTIQYRFDNAVAKVAPTKEKVSVRRDDEGDDQ